MIGKGLVILLLIVIMVLVWIAFLLREQLEHWVNEIAWLRVIADELYIARVDSEFEESIEINAGAWHNRRRPDLIHKIEEIRHHLLN